MSVGLHETWVDCLKRHIKDWKMRGPAGDGTRGPFSDETICQFIIEAHERIGGPLKTGIVFAPVGSGDESKRRTANAKRIMRYMTDEPNTEFESFQLFNLVPSILAAMPQNLAKRFINEYLEPAKFVASEADDDGEDGFGPEVAHKTQSATFSALHAISAASLNPTPELLAIAEREAVNAQKTFKRTRAFITKARNACKGAKAVLGKFTHRKDKVIA